MSEVSYIAYIDESGDDGIGFVKPERVGSASEWMVLGAVVVRIDRHNEVQPWVKDIINSINQPQLRMLHFAKLPHNKRIISVEKLGSMGVRCFVVISNKKNMSGYMNMRVHYANASAKSYFYNWMTRVLLESITDFCARDSTERYGTIKKLMVDFSRRDGVSLPGMIEYLAKIQRQSRSGKLFIKTRDIVWDVMDFSKLRMLDPVNRPGLQLSDVLSSSFYQALGDSRIGLAPNPEYATRLNRVIAKSKNGWQFGYGIKVMPNLDKVILTDGQRKIFDFYRGK
ncbi:MAG: DUF3800 domain-containing protein [Alphaproteobacteria bacterium]|nr:DUF3800 domain-containing protein [Alphaproteobacteria bacterium]